MISIFVSLLNGFFLKGSSNFCSQSEVMLLFVPNDPKSDLKLKVQTHNIKSQKYTKEGSNKPPWLNLTNKQAKSHIFEFENYPDMHACRDFISNLHVPWFAFIDWESISLVFFRGVSVTSFLL
jgi:hypothetical protein